MYKINYINPMAEEALKLLTDNYTTSDIEEADAVLMRSTNI